MKKTIKIIILILLILLVLCGAFAAYARHGWRLYGFDQCKDPSALSVTELTVTEDEVHIEGNVFDSASRFVDYRYEIKDGALYIGLRYDLFTGDGAHYSITINEDLSNISVVYLTNGTNNKLVWTLSTDDTP